MMQVDYDSPFFTLTFPFDKQTVEIVKNLPVREWSEKEKRWKIPRLSVTSLDSLDAVWTDKAKSARHTVMQILTKLVDLKFEEGEARGILRAYQSVGVEFLKTAKKALLADDMGLGKTVQSIAAAKELNLDRVLVLCPATMKWKWHNEFKKHYGLASSVVTGTPEERELIWSSPNIKYTIANYDLLRFDWDMIPRDWDCIIADEAVYLKNPSAQRTKLAKKLNAEYKFALSGIYVENSIMEAYSILQWVRPEVVPKNPKHFKDKYCVLDWMGNVVGVQNHNMPEFHALTSPFILRRTKQEKLPELPGKIYHDIEIDMTKKEVIEYAKLSKAFREWLDSGSSDSADLWDGVIQCRQFVEFPDIIESYKSWSQKPSKLVWLEDLYSEVDKVVVFTFFKESARRLRDYFKTPYYIDGDTKNDDRVPICDAFNEAPKAIFVSTDAAKMGVDLIGADNIVHYGHVHNPGTVRQREDRLDRFGQTQIVNVFKPRLRSTIDNGIIQVAQYREKISNALMEGQEAMSKAKLSKADFIKIVQGQDLEL